MIADGIYLTEYDGSLTFNMACSAILDQKFSDYDHQIIRRNTKLVCSEKVTNASEIGSEKMNVLITNPLTDFIKFPPKNSK